MHKRCFRAHTVDIANAQDLPIQMGFISQEFLAQAGGANKHFIAKPHTHNSKIIKFFGFERGKRAANLEFRRVRYRLEPRCLLLPRLICENGNLAITLQCDSANGCS
jgi:hypothetical protein